MRIEQVVGPLANVRSRDRVCESGKAGLLIGLNSLEDDEFPARIIQMSSHLFCRVSMEAQPVERRSARIEAVIEKWNSVFARLTHVKVVTDFKRLSPIKPNLFEDMVELKRGSASVGLLMWMGRFTCGIRCMLKGFDSASDPIR